MKKYLVLFFALFLAFIVSGCYTSGLGSESGDGGAGAAGGHTPAACKGGGECSHEGAECGDGEYVCHCGTWMSCDNPALDEECEEQPPHTCVVGSTCSGEGNLCEASDGDDLVCHCGRWMPEELSDISCGGGGSGGGTPSDDTIALELFVESNSYHVWCEGQFVACGDHRPDAQVEWQGDPWHSFGEDLLGGGLYAVTVDVPENWSLRYQCYLNNPNGTMKVQGQTLSVDAMRYTCADPWNLTQYEDHWLEVGSNDADYGLVVNLTGQAFNCQYDPPGCD